MATVVNINIYIYTMYLHMPYKLVGAHLVRKYREREIHLPYST